MVEFKTEDGKLICVFSGKMDTESSMAVEDEVFDQVQRNKIPTVFDLEKVTYASSAFFRICVKAARATPGMGLTVVNSPPFVRDGFRITQLDKYLDIK